MFSVAAETFHTVSTLNANFLIIPFKTVNFSSKTQRFYDNLWAEWRIQQSNAGDARSHLCVNLVNINIILLLDIRLANLRKCLFKGIKE